jgi:hypothetical protein
MDAAQATGPEAGEDAGAETATDLAAAPEGTPAAPSEQAATAPAQVVHLAPPPARETMDAAPTRLPSAQGHRLAPAREPNKPAQKEEEKQEDPDLSAQKGPSRDQRMRFAKRVKEMDSPEKARETLRYGVKIGRFSTDDLRAALEGEAQEKPDAASPAQPAQAAAPVPGTSPAPPPPPVPEKLIHGQPAAAVKRAAEKVHFVTAQLAAMGMAEGWGTVTPEPLTLFEGTEVAFECTGNPRTRLVELASVEVARVTGGSNGDSPFARRMEIGLLALATFGPGLASPLKNAAGAVTGRLARLVSIIGGQVKRWRR